MKKRVDGALTPKQLTPSSYRTFDPPSQGDVTIRFLVDSCENVAYEARTEAKFDVFIILVILVIMVIQVILVILILNKKISS